MKVILEVLNIRDGKGDLVRPGTNDFVNYGQDLDGLPEYTGGVLVEDLVKLKESGFTADEIVKMREAGVL